MRKRNRKPQLTATEPTTSTSYLIRFSAGVVWYGVDIPTHKSANNMNGRKKSTPAVTISRPSSERHPMRANRNMTAAITANAATPTGRWYPPVLIGVAMTSPAIIKGAAANIAKAVFPGALFIAEVVRDVAIVTSWCGNSRLLARSSVSQTSTYYVAA